jgi:hypothetical protein
MKIMEDKKEDRFKYVVAGVVLLVFIMVVYALAFKAIPETNKEIFIHTTGIIEGAVIAIVGYYFGSSSGSKAKSDTISKALEAKE